MKKYLILASKSRRRARILSSCKIKYKVYATDAYENIKHKNGVTALVIKNARAKAEAAARHYKKHIILAVDTLVLLKGKIIGKPKNKKHAFKMLKSLSNSIVYVYTGLYLLDTFKGKRASCIDKTKIRTAKIDAKNINKFFNHLGPYDKAGGFTIEGLGAVLFDNIDGSYFNVLGLPVNKLNTLLKKINSNIFEFI